MAVAVDGEAIVRRWIEEVLNKGNLTVVDELFAPEFVNLTDRNQPHGPEGVRQGVTQLRSAFPDLQVNLEDVFAHEDRVAWLYTCRGTHKGEFGGVAPTGRAVEFQGIVMGRLAGGRLTQGRGIVDSVALLQQLGQLVPGPAPAG